MPDNPTSHAIREALWLAVQLGGPPLLAMLAIGLVISLIQALTQIQEPTLAFLPKITVMAGALVLLGPHMVGIMQGYAAQLFDRLVLLGGLP